MDLDIEQFEVAEGAHRFLIPGRLLQIAFHTPKFPELYRSRLEDVGKEVLAVSMPTLARVDEDTPCVVTFLAHEQRYGFRSRVQGYRRGPLFLMLLDPPTRIHHVQMRNFFRIEMEMEAQLSVPRRRGELYPARIRNISGGGVFLTTPVLLEPGTLVVLDFALPSGTLIRRQQARVVRAVPPDPREGRPHPGLGMEFLHMDSRTRDRIIREIFARELEMLRLLGPRRNKP